MNFITKNFYIIFLVVMTMLILLIVYTPSPPFRDPLWGLVPTPQSSATMMRISVPHGWVLTYKSLSRGMVYVPDEKHEWKLNPSHT